MTAPAYDEDPGPEQPFISHLVELRDRLLRMIMAVAVMFLVLFPFANDLYTFVAEPIRAQLPEGSTMIATQVASPFLTPFKLALVAAVFLAMPYLLFQVWGFVAPGLYQHEKRFALPLLASSIALFYLGMAFAYVVVFPLVFAFFAATTPEGVAQMPDISFYLDFVLKIFFAFGIAFQIPIATILLVAMGMTTAESLTEKRPYVIVGCFVVGMLLTPPDVISQTLLAVPMWLLFEAGIFFSRFFRKDDAEEAEEPPPAAPGPGPGQGPGRSPAGGQPSPASAADPAVTAGGSNSGTAAAVGAGLASMAVGSGSGAEGSPEPLSATTASPAAAPPSPATDGQTPIPAFAPGEVIIGADIDGGDPFDRSRFVPLTPEEMEAELDAIEAAEAALDPAADLAADEDQSAPQATIDPIDALLERVKELRELENEPGARQLLYRVLADGNESQRFVAMNILTEMDQP
ncbi:MAG: twin-arginine translocase subunit TatC [Gammaproteobacteria bacterium]|jgi:sec-independent protein translocase protein TatC|nr:twin-arginine translocase subunit TatC [Gammaproteobacteria bacterium]